MGAGVDPGLGRWNQTLDAAKSYPKVESVPGLVHVRPDVSMLTIGLGCVCDLGGDCGGRGVGEPEVLKGVRQAVSGSSRPELLRQTMNLTSDNLVS